MPVRHTFPHKRKIVKSLLEAVDGFQKQVKSTVGPKIAQEIVDEVKTSIQTQSLPWPPLTPDYAKWKEKQGHDKRILIQTGDYLSAINWKQIENNHIVIGVDDRIHHSGLPMQTIARIMEFGSASRGIPPRPHWKPAIDKIMTKYRKKI